MQHVTLTASGVISNFEERGIAPDETHVVKQGIISLWRYNGCLIGEVTTNSSLRLYSRYAYYNTNTPQEIADEIISFVGGKETAEIVSAAAAALGSLGGQSTSEAKQAASRANGKKGGRPRKNQ